MTPPEWFSELTMPSRVEFLDYIRTIVPREYREWDIVPKEAEIVEGCPQIFSQYLEYINLNVCGYLHPKLWGFYMIAMETVDNQLSINNL